MNQPQHLPAPATADAPVPAAATVTGTASRPADVELSSVWRSFTATLSRRRGLFALIFFGVLAAVVVVALVTPKRYTTDVKLIAGNPNSVSQSPNAQTGLPILNALLLANTAQSAETYAELFTETPIVQRVIDDLKLKTTVTALAGAIKVKPVTNTNIISLSVTWKDANTAAAIANDFAAVFVAREADLVASQANGALAFLSKQLPIAQQRLVAAQAKLSRYESAHHIADLGAQTTAVVAAAAAIDAKISATQLEKRQAQAQIASLSAQLAGTKPSSPGGESVAQNPVLQQLRSQLANLEVQLASAQQQYTDEHPTVVHLKQQIDDLTKQISRTPTTIVATTNTIANPVYQQLSQQLANAKATSASDDAQLATLTRQRAAINPQIAALPAATARIAALNREVKLAEDVYNALQQKYDDATVSRASGISDVTITQPANAQTATKTPHVALNVAVGAVLALVLSLAVVFLVDWMDGRIRDEHDIESGLNLPVLASIPLLPLGGAGAKAIPANLRTASQESYYQLVLAMRYSTDRPLRSVTITSPLKGDGKSTVAVNVATALGEIAISNNEREARVLVIDADLRRPSLHKKLGVENGRGLSDILVGRAGLDDCALRTELPGVDVLTSGLTSPNPIRLLQSNRFDDLLREACEKYVTVIVDAPALVPVLDAAIVAAKTDGAVMVLSAGVTDMRATRKALARLEAVGVNDLVGTVINRAAPPKDDYSDYFASALPALE
ncbi:MAG TPA: polysaccharide biosynthesis tyrosine autokinase [Candidatus Acidoferrum sp.]|nr:polysaccharide biosynthesis tyrosine autokinase [Candidatus Acidoferrum sp.]